MNDRERFFVLVIGSIIAIGVTAAIIYLATTATDTGERSILIGGLIGTGAFGGGALFSLLGVGHKTTGGGATVTIPQDPPDPPITVETGRPRRD